MKKTSSDVINEKNEKKMRSGLSLHQKIIKRSFDICSQQLLIVAFQFFCHGLSPQLKPKPMNIFPKKDWSTPRPFIF